jgi:eukaryotic-like serine/threonine-protein kinase
VTERKGDSDRTAGFAEVWSTLALDSAALATGETVRPGPAVATSLGTLPQLSIRLGGDAGTAVSAPLGDIQVTGTLGEGGMGKVLLAEQRSLRREVALKTLRDLDATRDQIDALLAEGMLTGHLEHPNITPVHQLGVDGSGRPIIVMKRISGVAWSVLLDDPTHAAWQGLHTAPGDQLRAHLEILMQVCNALSLAHDRGVIHRDVKPDNVMIGEFGEVYLVDWGIALELSRAQPGPRRLAGTPCYLAPEMLDDSLPLGPATDVYLLGATLHEIVTGHAPHGSGTLHHVLAAAWESHPAVYDASVPGELAALCRRSMSRDPELRPQSALAFRTALKDYLLHRGSLALAHAADDSLDRLTELRRDPAHDRGEVLRLAAECRFGHLQALREWPRNPIAAAGLRRGLTQLVELELAAENLAGARAWLKELEPSPPELGAAVTALEARLTERAAAAERLAALEREHDLSLGSRERKVIAAGLGGVAVAITAYILYGRLGGAQPTPESTIWFGVAVLAVSVVMAFLGRRALLSNRVNRGLMGTFVATVALVLVHRILAVAGGRSLAVIFQVDLFILGTACLTLGFLVAPTWLIGAAAALLGGIASPLFPAYTDTIFTLSSLVLLGCLAFGWRKR